MVKNTIYFISKNRKLQRIFSALLKKIMLDKIMIIDSKDDLFESFFQLEKTDCLCIYDSDFSSSMNSSSFIKKTSELSPNSKVIIMGNDTLEAKALINKQTYPFGYVNKQEDKNRIEDSLLALILKSTKSEK